jgi:hypothetical protein
MPFYLSPSAVPDAPPPPPAPTPESFPVGESSDPATAPSYPIFAQRIINPLSRITHADSLNYKTLCIGAENGTRVNGINVTNSDSIDRILQFALAIGGVDYPIGEVKVPAKAGNDGSAAVNSVGINSTRDFPSFDTEGHLFIKANQVLKVRAKTVVSTGREINIVGFGGEY